MKCLMKLLNHPTMPGDVAANRCADEIFKKITLGFLFMAVSLSILGIPRGGRVFGEQPTPPALVTVPNVTRLDRAKAETVLSDAGLAVGDIDKQHKVTIPTGVVIGQNPQVGEEVSQGSAIDLVVVKEPVEGIDSIAIPAAWAGEWEITFTYLDAATNNRTAAEIITDAICPEDPLGLKLLEKVLGDKPYITLDEINGTASDNHMQASFSGIFHASVPAPLLVVHFDVGFAAEFDMYLSDDNILTGTLLWSASGVLGDILPEDVGQTVIISGIRLSTEPGGLCDLPRSSFLQKFLRNPLLFDEEGAL